MPDSVRRAARRQFEEEEPGESARSFFVAKAPLGDLGQIVTDEIVIGSQRLLCARPAEPERLLSHPLVSAAHDDDGYMPYWATVWPVARHLANHVLKEASLRVDGEVLEMGCGLGLPGLAALARGWSVTFSDYDETALEFVRRNVALNGFSGAKTLPMDWRSPLDQSFALILGSDLIYEEAFAPRVAAAFAKMLLPGGVGLLADQDRPYAAVFRGALKAYGLSWKAQAFTVEEAGRKAVPGVLYEISKPR